MNSDLQSQVLNAEERLRQAMLHSDVDVIDELIAPDLLFTNHVGQILTKEDDVAFHRSGILRLKELNPSEQQVQLHTGFAVVSVLMHLIGSNDGTPLDTRIRYTRVWSISPDGSIQIIAGHASSVPSA